MLHFGASENLLYFTSMNVWPKIASLMKNEGIDKQTLAEICHVQPSAVTKWADGKGMRPDKLKCIAVHFGVSVDSLMSDDIAEKGNIQRTMNQLEVRDTPTKNLSKNPDSSSLHAVADETLDEFLSIAVTRKDYKAIQIVSRELEVRRGRLNGRYV